jgi:hypothetical protein
MEQPSPSNERLSSISLVNVDDFHTNCQEATTRTRRIRQNNLINKLLSERYEFFEDTEF